MLRCLVHYCLHGRLHWGTEGAEDGVLASACAHKQTTGMGCVEELELSQLPELDPELESDPVPEPNTVSVVVPELKPNQKLKPKPMPKPKLTLEWTARSPWETWWYAEGAHPPADGLCPGYPGHFCPV